MRLTNKEIAEIRGKYSENDLTKDSILKDPFKQLSVWLEDAVNSEIIEPNAMTISTVDGQGIPSSRVVLLKSIEDDGLTFFTNYNSKKSNDISKNNTVSILFFWRELGRQIRITGKVEKITKEESEEYFKSRPYESKIAAWASNQSSEIPDRDFLEKKFDEIRNKFDDENIPLPEFWGGYRVFPYYFEFWQGRLNRLHDRIAFKKKDDSWEVVRLAP